MKKTLEYVWNWYLAEYATDPGEREKALCRAMTDAENDLQLLTDDELASVDAYVDRLYKLMSRCEEETFIKSLRFATAYMVEALNKEQK